MTSRVNVWRLLPVQLALLGLVGLPYLCHSAAPTGIDEVAALVISNTETFSRMSSSMWKIREILNLVHNNERVLKRRKEENNSEGGYNHIVAVEKLGNEVRNLTEKLNSIQSDIAAIQGNRGPVGLRGEKGVSGGPGEKGEGIIHGRQGESGQSIVGMKGYQGFPGYKGSQGEDGGQGKSGRPGDTGSRGPRGKKGDKASFSR